MVFLKFKVSSRAVIFAAHFYFMEEVWLQIKDYPDYRVSNLGRVKSFRGCANGFIMKQHINTRGYYKIGLSNSQVKKNIAVHRLVCSAFHENPENKPQVNHKDLNQLNNYSTNLEWVTAKENTNHAQINGRMPIRNPDKCYKCKGRLVKKVIDISNGQIYESVDDLCDKLNLNKANLRRQISGERYSYTPYRYLGMENIVKIKPEIIKQPKPIKERVFKPKKVYIPHPLPTKKVIMYSTDGVQLRTFESSRDAANFVNSSYDTFRKAIKKSPTNFTKGYVWEVID